jgi:hypothetical protein
MIATAKKRIAEHETKAWWKQPANDEVTRMQLMVVKGAFLVQEMMIERFANAFGLVQAPTNQERR